MASAQRLSVKGNIAAGILTDPDHCDLQILRMRNEVAAKHGKPLPHPDVPPLSADTGARFGVNYYDLELRRQAGQDPTPQPIKPPSIAPLYQQYEPSSTDDSMFIPLDETMINWKQQRHKNPCLVGGPCCMLRKRGSCAADGRHVKHGHVASCPKQLGNEQRRQERLRARR